MRRGAFWLLLPAAWLALAVAVGAPAAQPADSGGEAERRAVEEMRRRGQPVPPPEERRRLIESFFPNLGRATFDTTPVELEIAGWRLAVPANYISSVDRDAQGRMTMIVLHAVLPDMEGVTRANAPCVRLAPNCADYVRVLVKLPQRFVAREILENVLRVWPQVERLPWPNGTEIIRLLPRGPNGSGPIYFRAERSADDQTILVACSVSEQDGLPHGCIAQDNRIGGLAYSYVFSGQHIEQLVQLDEQVRALIRRFLSDGSEIADTGVRGTFPFDRRW